MISARLPGEGLTLGRRYTGAAAAPAPEFLPPAPPPPAAPAYPPVPGPGAYARFLSHAHGTHPFAYAPPSVSTAVAAPNAYRGAPYVAPLRARTSPGFAPPALSPSNHRRIAVERAHTERIQAERAQADRAQTERVQVERTQTESAHAERASPEYFKRGALIRLEGGALRRVEEMRTEDFVASAERNSALTISECTVLKLEEREGSLAITLSYNHNRSQVEMETTPEHPFFVYGQGWASSNPTRTLALYDLHVRRLRVGDVCVSLVQSTAGGAPSPPLQSQLCRTTTCPTTATGTAVSARLQTSLHTNQNSLHHHSSQSSHGPQHSSQGLLLTSQSSLHACQSSLHTSQNTLHTSHNFFHNPHGPLYTSHSPLHASQKLFHPPMGSIHSSQGSDRASQGLISSAQVPIESSLLPSSAYISRLEPVAVQCYPENLSTKEDFRKRRWSAPDKCEDEPLISRKH